MFRAALVFIAIGSASMAQGPAEFEVASIRPHLSVNPGGESSDTNVLPGGRLVARNVTVRKLIRNAFLVEDSRISGAPGWIDTQSYDIDAKTGGGVEITRDNISLLMKSLLESRFQLKFHREQKDTAEYALEVVRNAVKLTPDMGDAKPSMSTNSNGALVTLKAMKLSMADFAGSLARQMGRPVVDRTGLAGDFDFDLKWSTEQATDGAGPSIFTALQGIGLRLVSTRGLVEVIVIDRVEKASEN